MAVSMRRAERKKVRLKLGISAQSGGGKTLSSLIFAYGIIRGTHPDWSDEEIWQKICVVDSENGSSELYVNYTVKGTGFHIGEFNVISLSPPFTTDKYNDSIDLAVKEGIEVLIIDSMTHLWNGQGALLEKQGNVAKRTGNSYTAWREITPEFNRFIDNLLQSDIHIIATMRSKTEYVQEKDEKGRTTIRKVGMAPIFRDGVEYEFSMFMDLDSEHQAHVTKDRTGILADEYFVVTEKEGIKVANWLNSGKEMVPNEDAISVKKASEAVHVSNNNANLGEMIEQIDNLAKALGEAGVSKTDIANAIKKHFVVNGKPSANYNAIKNSEVAEMVIKELESLIK